MTTQEDSDQTVYDDVTEHPRYDLILKMILWGEPREKVYRRMEVNSVTGELADRLYAAAFAERVREIRAGSSSQMAAGVAALFSSVGTLWYFLPADGDLRYLPKSVFVASFLMLGFGLMKSVTGMLGYLRAPTKEGSLADDEDWE